MQPLPAIELIGFLNWVDLNRTELLPAHQTIEEFFLNQKNKDSAKKLASRYLAENPPKEYPNTNEGRYEKWVDMILAKLKLECIKKFRKSSNRVFWWRAIDGADYNERMYHEVMETMRDFFLKNLNEFGTPRNLITPTSDKIIDDIRNVLSFGFGNEVEDYLADLDGTSAKAVKAFLRYFLQHAGPSEKNDNIPVSVINKYIQEYVDDSFFVYHLSASKKIELKDTLERAFWGNNQIDTDYFARLTSVKRSADRYWDRRVRYKCVFLAEGPEFYRLVEDNWKTLNDYSGDYLDIFYNPDELLMKGYQVAEKLEIRSQVNEYPSIFLWHTSLNEGRAIPVGGLQLDDLLSVIKIIIEDIAKKSSFDTVVQNTLANIEKIKLISEDSEVLQRTFIDNLYLSCLQIQSNPVVFGKANENLRNTQIRDLLGNLLSSPVETNSQRFQFSVLDQTLQGASRTGKTFGEIDLLVKLDQYPYAIIEALNIQSDKNGQHWNRTTLDEHIRRIGKYDQNGLKRNVVLIYANSDNFEQFYASLINSLLTSTSHYMINGCRIDEIRDITDELPNHTANTRVIRSRYYVNGIERTLFLFTVRF